MKEKCLLIGLGDIGVGYDLNLNNKYCLTHARAIEQNNNFELIGGVDICEERRSIFEKEYRVKSFSNIKESLNETDPSIVIIATPTETHYEILHRVAHESQPKIVICEKPLSYDLNEAIRMRELAVENDIEIFVNYFRISDPAINHIRNQLFKYFDSPTKGVVWYSKGLLHNGSHFINLMQYWFGEIKSYNITSNQYDVDIKYYEPDITLNFDNADILFISAWEEYYSHYTVEILSKSGRLEYGINGKITWQNVIKDNNFEGYKILNEEKEIINSSMDKYQMNVYQNIYKHLRGKDSHLCTVDMAIKSLDVILKIFKKSKNE